MKMVWNVFYFNFNKREITTYNVFNHSGFMNDLIKFHKETKVYNREQLSQKLERLARYYFWCKCEWEVIVSEWPPAPPERNVEIKISVFDQILANWEIFVGYVWNSIPFLAAEIDDRYLSEKDGYYCSFDSELEGDEECEDEYEYEDECEDECEGEYEDDYEDECECEYEEEHCIESHSKLTKILFDGNKLSIFFK